MFTIFEDLITFYAFLYKSKTTCNSSKIHFYFICHICYIYNYAIVVQLLGHVQLFVTPRTAACQASLSLTVSWHLPKF